MLSSGSSTQARSQHSVQSKKPDSKVKQDGQNGGHIRFLDRLEHFTWAWFCLPMSTGGIALLLSPAVQPHSFIGLEAIGKVVYIIDLVLFSLITIAITYRFTRWPSTFIASLTHPTESLFAATSLLSTASIIACIARYGISSIPDAAWLIITYRVLFWIYVAVTFIWAIFAYGLLFTSPALKIQDMTPAWDLPIFPFMLSGTIASTGASLQSPDQAVPMIVAGVTAQGLGFTISILMYASYIRRMIQYGLPVTNALPAMFIAVGPPSFTSLALLGMANAWPRQYINYFGSNIYPNDSIHPAQQELFTIQIMRVLATCTSVFIWSLAAWFFAIAVVANVMQAKNMRFHLNWWAFVFPNTGFTIATISIGKVLESEGIKWVGSIMSIGIIALWFFVAVHHVRAIWTRSILWEGQDEDVYRTSVQSKKEKDVGTPANDVEKQD